MTAVMKENTLFYFILFLNLIHCISFAKHQNESATDIHENTLSLNYFYY